MFSPIGLAVIILENINTCQQDLQPESECKSTECKFYGVFISFGIAGILLVGCAFTIIQRYIIR